MSGRPLPGTNDDVVRPPLRYRRFGGGYRREDVDLLLAELRLTLRALELELGTLRDRGRDLERQLREARAEIDAYHVKSYEIARVMDAVRERATAAEQQSREQAAATVAEAQADAARRIAEAEARVEELAATREALLSGMRELVERVGESIAAAVSDTEPGTEPGTVSDTVSETDGLDPLENGFPGADLSSLRERFSTRVELDAGPFVDFDSVSEFERRLADLADVEDVYVRRVTGNRAVIELTVARGTPLLARMREQLPYRLEVRDRSLDRLVVDVDAPAPAGSQ